MIPYIPRNLSPFFPESWGIQTEPFPFFAGFVLVTFLLLRQLKNKNISVMSKVYLSAILIGCGLAMSRLWYFFYDFRGWQTVFLYFDPRFPGFVSVGMLTGAIIGGFVYVYFYEGLRGTSFLHQVAKIGDEGLLFLGLAAFWFRAVGCFLYGDVLGSPSTLPWAIQWPTLGLRHPTAAYLSFYGLLVFIFSIWVYKRKRWDGQVALVSVLGYLMGRFLFDFLRVTENFFYGMSFIQVYSLFFFLVGMVIYNKLDKRNGI